ncbi:T-cell antigen CD7 [Dromiciops gliroides]|uniref:T-cell antigen CD7 n=1 Tax=Dromiciops gliroides TaxID=33562 RepID=UPI001CC3C040|nr:T-cell antigen CD7 [Dromiciops gliroides]
MFQLLILPMLFLLLSRTLAEDEVEQSPSLIKVEEDGTINITCITKGVSRGLYLKRRTVRPMNVIHLSDKSKLIFHENYKNRTNISGSLNNLTITISNIELNDIDIYTCEATVFDNLQGNGTILMVTEKKWKNVNSTNPPVSINPWLWVVFIVMSFFIGLFLWPLLMTMKKRVYNLRRPQHTSCSVYEDMSFVIQQNNTCHSNQYS